MHSRKSLAARLTTLTLVGMAVLISGCDHTVNHWRESRYATEVTPQVPTAAPKAANVSLRAAKNGGFTPQSLANLNTLLKTQGRLKNQTLVMTPHTEAGQALGEKLQQVLLQQGARQAQLRLAPIQKADARWDLKVLSQAVVVDVPDCAVHDADSWTVHPYSSVGPLGCANRANIAQMVSDPRDLMRARTLDPGDGRAAVNAVSRYYDDEVRELLDIDFNED